jgi:hypothetical protein
VKVRLAQHSDQHFVPNPVALPEADQRLPGGVMSIVIFGRRFIGCLPHRIARRFFLIILLAVAGKRRAIHHQLQGEALDQRRSQDQERPHEEDEIAFAEGAAASTSAAK